MKLLVADDSDMYRKMLKRLLERWGYEVVLAANGYEAQCILDSDDAPQLAILNCFMPGIGGLELCELIRAREQGYLYTILLSAADRKMDVLRGFQSGADDYLCKPFEELELHARIKVGERIIRSHEQYAEAREALTFEASHDSLLRIWNHGAIIDLLNTELSRAKRLQTSLCVFFADLDFFKRVNDSCGHLVGDDVLRSVAERISNTVREYDHVGRYGGEEFLVVLPNCTAEAAQEVAERVRQAIGDKPIITANLQVEITVSIGVSQWRYGQEIGDILHQADVAMYRAKFKGRNRIEVVKPGEAESLLMGKRQEVRHALNLPIRIWGMDATGQTFEQEATTIDVTTTGARITGVKHLLQRGCVIGIEHCSSRARYRVTWVGTEGDKPGEIGVQLIEPGKFIWGRVISRVFGEFRGGEAPK